MAAGLMVSYVRARAEGLGFASGTGMAAIGLAPREVRVAVLVVGLILGLVDLRWLGGALGLITILATIATIQRILFVYRQSTKQEVND
jgi:CDP-diacylglycerol--glycerol-3-phosphate 3-phosphatidyltransferase